MNNALTLRLSGRKVELYKWNFQFMKKWENEEEIMNTDEELGSFYHFKEEKMFHQF